MSVSYISQLSYFECANQNIQFEDISIIKDNALVGELFANEVFLLIEGTSNFESFYNQHNCIWTGDLLTISPDLYQANHLLDNKKFIFLHLLWFIKDNSVNAHRSFLQNLDVGIVNRIDKSVLFSNASGKFETEAFSDGELQSLTNIKDKVRQLFLTFKPDGNDYTINTILLNGANIVAQSKNRLLRAFMFLQVVRTNSDLGIKISMYMACFECLFSSNYSEIAHQLAERSSLFLGGDEDTKRSNFQKMKTAYGIRSKLVHGDLINKSDNELIELSIFIDSFLRNILLKIIDGNSEIFTNNNNGYKKRFEKYFADLISKN